MVRIPSIRGDNTTIMSQEMLQASSFDDPTQVLLQIISPCMCLASSETEESTIGSISSFLGTQHVWRTHSKACRGASSWMQKDTLDSALQFSGLWVADLEPRGQESTAPEHSPHVCFSRIHAWVGYSLIPSTLPRNGLHACR